VRSQPDRPPPGGGCGCRLILIRVSRARRAAAPPRTSCQRRESALLLGPRSSAAQEADDWRVRSPQAFEVRSRGLLKPLRVWREPVRVPSRLFGRRLISPIWVFLAPGPFAAKPSFLRVGFPWISLDSLVRIETYQRVTRDKRAKVFLEASRRLNRRNGAFAFACGDKIVHSESLRPI